MDDAQIILFCDSMGQICQKYITLVLLEHPEQPEYLYCDNPRFYVFISDLHFFSGLFRVSMGVSSYGADYLTHTNDLQKSHT